MEPSSKQINPVDQDSYTESTPENSNSSEQERSPDQPLFTSASDEEVWEAYLASEQEWEEVYRRLADS
ncbi:hypothetical protein [Laspinema olomoucense]|uniref:Uncharacterized protein n=1 Tax=Laspinema olomoucense D3b TaxID=2953688 RepID=A0ABT2N5N3_9CYAN|nr:MULTISPECIES: hypothetical protein [unclassified Laspinema]MCT7972937.1 hypothetical protein [Laspinema sp. D3d]MCT7978009.1 hypothetical protein [Laspinema sp. D3b]MCT7987092.1 hypothetical protein [Laspinema sp. D3a]MCT7994214.1 hypothetical protein [Laspinema sp. D3c]